MLGSTIVGVAGKYKIGDLVRVRFLDHTSKESSSPQSPALPAKITLWGVITRLAKDHIAVGTFIDSEVTEWDEYCVISSTITDIKKVKQ